MSYSVEEFFDEYMLPELRKALKEESLTEDNVLYIDYLDRFIKALKRNLSLTTSQRGADFSKKILEAIINPDDDPMDTDQFIKKCFCLHDSEKSIRKLEYSTDDSIIKADFIKREKEQQEDSGW